MLSALPRPLPGVERIHITHGERNGTARFAGNSQTFRAMARFKRHEQADGGFAKKYGMNRNRRNAFGKCVSKKVRDS
jgi:hypothetical protein